MSLLILMYHRARAGRFGNSPAVLEEHFAHLADAYPTVLPGEALTPGGLNVCLSFDDGYFDFYAVVFPLLKKFRLRALLAIPPAVVREQVDATAAERLNVECDEAFANPDAGGFCTWPELTEMAGSGYVTVAAHGATHCRLDTPGVNLALEVVAPKILLASRVNQAVDNFVFPFGRTSRRSLDEAQSTYRHVLRIGGAMNCGDDRQLLYRVDADQMESPWALFSPPRLVRYRARYWWNRIRSR